MDTFVDYYELLHVQPSAPEPVIKASYRAMMQKLNHHPDRGGDVGFAQLLNDAVKTLCNPQTRAQYDALRKQFLPDAADDPDKNSQGTDQSTSTWGEPGGSPNVHPGKKPNDSQEADPDTQNTDRHAGNTSRSDTGYSPLPSKPQCPFCLSIYPSDVASFATPISYTGTQRCRSCNGARTPIAHIPQTSNDELRKMHRQYHKTDARLWLSWPSKAPLPSVLSDFSPAGCALIFTDNIDLNHTLMIDTGLFNAICNVRHCKRSDSQNYLIGLEFVTLDMNAVPGALLSATA